jgi:3-hydroxy-9,10-secoandrosta-1,3,5(10)-triene-9,17-dione monooxygenase reductase component
MRAPDETMEFRQALGSFPTGVTVVTTTDAQGLDVGVTASSFNAVSLQPPLVLWSLGRSSRNFPAFERARHFAVHVLASHQSALALRFARIDGERFAGLTLDRGADGIALLTDFVARFECRTVHCYPGVDHVIFVGEVLRFLHRDAEPLFYQRGKFTNSGESAD